MSFVELRGVSRVYRAGTESIRALDNVGFDVEEGSFTVVLGPSGSGKSTTLNLLGGMDRATSGTILVGGTDVTELSAHALTDYRRHDVGFVFQFYNLIPNLNVYENIDVACRLGTDPLSAADVLREVGLECRLRNFPSELSGGEQQRVSIARALCKNPKLLLCDEPTGALDSETGKMVLSLLQGMSRTRRKTVVVVTHNAMIAPTADRVVRLKDGRVASVVDNDAPAGMEEVMW